MEVKYLNKTKLPESIIMIAGRVSAIFPDVEYIDMSYIGVEANMTIQTRD
jgi:hypothetical protein